MALVMGERRALSHYNKVRYMKEHPKSRGKKAIILCRKAEVNIFPLRGNIDDIDRFHYLYGNQYIIVVYPLKPGSRHPEVIYSGNAESNGKIYLFYYNRHFVSLKVLPPF